jgi:hypothetical protein
VGRRWCIQRQLLLRVPREPPAGSTTSPRRRFNSFAPQACPMRGCSPISRDTITPARAHPAHGLARTYRQSDCLACAHASKRTTTTTTPATAISPAGAAQGSWHVCGRAAGPIGCALPASGGARHLDEAGRPPRHTPKASDGLRGESSAVRSHSLYAARVQF